MTGFFIWVFQRRAIGGPFNTPRKDDENGSDAGVRRRASEPSRSADRSCGIVKAIGRRIALQPLI
jgi:hypothetical protein